MSDNRVLRRRGRATALAAVVLATVAPAPAAAQSDSLDITAALALARAGSPVLVAEAARLRGAEGVSATARAARWPRLSADALYLRVQDPPGLALGPLGAITPIPQNGYVARLSFVQPLYAGGRITQAGRAAAFSERAAGLSREQADVELSAQVAHAHDAVLLARALLGVAEAAAAVLDSSATVARARFEGGAAARADVLRAETRVALAQSEVRAAQSVLAESADRLATAIGVDPASLPPVGGALAPAELSSDTLASDVLVRAARGARPDVEALGALARAAESRARAAGGAVRPAVSAYASTLATRPELVTGRRRWGTELFGGVIVSWRVFDWGASAGEETTARAEARRAEAEAALVGDAAAASVLAQLRELRRAAGDIAAGRANVQRAERALAIARASYADGAAIQLEVLTAEADLTRVRSDLLRAVHAHRSAAVELRRAVGRPSDAPLPTRTPTPRPEDR